MSAEIPFQRAVIFLLVGNRYLAKTRLFSPWYGKPEKSSLVCHHHYVIGKYRNQFFLLASSSTCTLPAANSPTCPLGNMPKVVTSFRAANTSNSVSMFGQVIRVLEIGRNTNELDGFSRVLNLPFIWLHPAFPLSVFSDAAYLHHWLSVTIHFNRYNHSFDKCTECRDKCKPLYFIALHIRVVPPLFSLFVECPLSDTRCWVIGHFRRCVTERLLNTKVVVFLGFLWFAWTFSSKEVDLQ